MNINDLQRPQKLEFMDDVEIRKTLSDMEKDIGLKTTTEFRKKHITYLREHPKVNPQHYLANVRTMIKIR